jgi:hypothetical protein
LRELISYPMCILVLRTQLANVQYGARFSRYRCGWLRR